MINVVGDSLLYSFIFFFFWFHRQDFINVCGDSLLRLSLYYFIFFFWFHTLQNVSKWLQLVMWMFAWNAVKHMERQTDVTSLFEYMYTEFNLKTCLNITLLVYLLLLVFSKVARLCGLNYLCYFRQMHNISSYAGILVYRGVGDKIRSKIPIQSYQKKKMYIERFLPRLSASWQPCMFW